MWSGFKYFIPMASQVYVLHDSPHCLDHHFLTVISVILLPLASLLIFNFHHSPTLLSHHCHRFSSHLHHCPHSGGSTGRGVRGTTDSPSFSQQKCWGVGEKIASSSLVKLQPEHAVESCSKFIWIGFSKSRTQCYVVIHTVITFLPSSLFSQSVVLLHFHYCPHFITVNTSSLHIL